MRSIEEVRAHFVSLFEHGMRFPHNTGEAFILTHLQNLAFIDQADIAFNAEMEALGGKGADSARGIMGGFGYITGVFNSCSDEVASVIAEVAFRLGYLTPRRALSEAEYLRLLEGLQKNCERDWTLTEIEAEYGEPSWPAKGRHPNSHSPWSLAYGTADRTKHWVFFDFWNDSLWIEGEGWQKTGKYGEVPVLRNVRVPARRFKEGFIFTPFGRQLLKEHGK
jgi:hypothetical protein